MKLGSNHIILHSYDQFGQYHFTNGTNYNIAYNMGLGKFNILPKSTIIFKEKSRGEGKNLNLRIILARYSIIFVNSN